MDSITSKTPVWLYIMAFLAILVSLYPIAFNFIPGADGLFRSKTADLLASHWYQPIFYIHTSFGGLALLAGSTQFFKKLREKRISLHRALGKVYVFAVLLSGITGLVIAAFATGGWIAISGFTLMAIGWLITTTLAYVSIRKLDIGKHRRWMMYSYALCFSAVTLRVYLGSGIAMGLAFMDFYPYLAWLSWVPNVLFIKYRITKLS